MEHFGRPALRALGACPRAGSCDLALREIVEQLANLLGSTLRRRTIALELNLCHSLFAATLAFPQVPKCIRPDQRPTLDLGLERFANVGHLRRKLEPSRQARHRITDPQPDRLRIGTEHVVERQRVALGVVRLEVRIAAQKYRHEIGRVAVCRPGRLAVDALNDAVADLRRKQLRARGDLGFSVEDLRRLPESLCGDRR